MIDAFRNGETKCGKRAARYSGALVFDFHRTLLQGGVSMYPSEEKKPEGKRARGSNSLLVPEGEAYLGAAPYEQERRVPEPLAQRRRMRRSTSEPWK